MNRVRAWIEGYMGWNWPRNLGLLGWPIVLSLVIFWAAPWHTWPVAGGCAGFGLGLIWLLIAERYETRGGGSRPTRTGRSNCRPISSSD